MIDARHLLVKHLSRGPVEFGGLLTAEVGDEGDVVSARLGLHRPVQGLHAVCPDGDPVRQGAL